MTEAGAVADPPLLVSAAALVRGRAVLVQRRPAGKAHAGLWEFPGGKIEPGETPTAALARELEEELGIVADAVSMVPIGFGCGEATERPLILLLHLVPTWRGEPAALHASEMRWIAPDALRQLPMPPADRPLIAALEAWFASGMLEARAGIEPACKDLQSSA